MKKRMAYLKEDFQSIYTLYEALESIIFQCEHHSLGKDMQFALQRAREEMEKVRSPLKIIEVFDEKENAPPWRFPDGRTNRVGMAIERCRSDM